MADAPADPTVLYEVRDKVARITIAFRVRRAGGGTASTAVSMQDDVYRRGFDPNLTDPTPGCW